jgi:hypothetical protein
MSDTNMSIHPEDEVSFADWSPMSDTSMSIHLEDEVIFPDWSPMSDTSMSIHLEDEVSFPDWLTSSSRCTKRYTHTGIRHRGPVEETNLIL